MSDLYNFAWFNNVEPASLLMIMIALIIIYIGTQKKCESLTLLPIGFGMLFSNISIMNSIDIFIEFSVIGLLNQGLMSSLYPALILLGIGAMTDISPIIANPKLVIIGFTAQIAIFTTFICALFLGFGVLDSASIGLLASANAPVIVYFASKLTPFNIAVYGLTVYLLMALVPVFQPPIIKLLTTPKERTIQMKEARIVSQKERMIFPIIGFIITSLIAPSGAILFGMFFLGNLLRECEVVKQLAITARTVVFDISSIMIGLCIGVLATPSWLYTNEVLYIILLGIFALILATASGIIGAKVMNLFLKDKINPIIGAAGVSALPNAVNTVDKVGKENNVSLLEHALAPGVAGLIGSTVVAGVLLSLLM